MYDSICRAYTALLRDVDPRLSMRAYQSGHAERTRVYWIMYDLEGRPLKLTTLEAGIRRLRAIYGLPDDFRVGPGTWIKHFIRWVRYERDVAQAKYDLSHPLMA